MLAADPTRTDAKSSSFTLAITHTVDRSATVKSSCAEFTTNPRLAVRVRMTPLSAAISRSLAPSNAARGFHEPLPPDHTQKRLS